jgi:hypothetical protein
MAWLAKLRCFLVAMLDTELMPEMPRSSIVWLPWLSKLNIKPPEVQFTTADVLTVTVMVSPPLTVVLDAETDKFAVCAASTGSAITASKRTQIITIGVIRVDKYLIQPKINVGKN